MDDDAKSGQRYRVILSGELGDEFAFLFENMELERVAGTTVLTGTVLDQTQLHGLLSQVQDLGVELVSVETIGDRSDSQEEQGPPSS
jgi:hypothetical protein